TAALAGLKKKEVTILPSLAAGTHLGATNLDFQVEQYIYKRKCDGTYIEARAVLPLKLAELSVTLPETLVSKLCCALSLSLEPFTWLPISVLEASMTGSRQLSRSQDFPGC
ncbi:40S ribosomal protein SA, partial [Galemys pyrenaicus]